MKFELILNKLCTASECQFQNQMNNDDEISIVIIYFDDYSISTWIYSVVIIDTSVMH